MRLLPFGVDGLLVEVDGLESAIGLHAALTAAALPGVVELIPAAATVLIRFNPGATDARRLARAVPGLRRTLSDGTANGESHIITIPVVYDGPDLPDVAALSGLSIAEVIRRHRSAVYRVAFQGFAPGFAYLVGGDPTLAVPRRDTPRTAVASGSVGLAGPFTGVYPRQSPGGWQLIGRTHVPMWDPTNPETPALLRPGMQVRFETATTAVRPAGGRVTTSARVPGMQAPIGACSRAPVAHTATSRSVSTPDPSTSVASRRIIVDHVGLLATVQDLGRPGHAALGVAPSGAMDRPALRRANRLVGNPRDAAAIEFVGALAVTADGPLVVALTAAAGPISVRTETGERAAERDRAVALEPGDQLIVEPARRGVYGYLAVLGGIRVPADERLLGSAATDTLAGLGPLPLRSGDELTIGSDHAEAVGDLPEPGPSLPSDSDTRSHPEGIRVRLGPRDDWFTEGALRVLTAQVWTVQSRSNRIGIRLNGDRELERIDDRELPSEGMVRGAVQVPPDGQPVVFAADHPVTGGYPVIATVVPEDLARLVQVPPGGRIRFTTQASGVGSAI